MQKVEAIATKFSTVFQGPLQKIYINANILNPISNFSQINRLAEGFCAGLV